MSTAAIAAIVTGPRRQYALRYRNCQVSSIRAGSLPASRGTTWSRRYAATASSRPFRVASPRPVSPSSVVILRVTKLRLGLVTMTSARVILMQPMLSRSAGAELGTARADDGEQLRMVSQHGIQRGERQLCRAPRVGLADRCRELDRTRIVVRKKDP